MRVLMFGWEFPPFFAGGVGMVCYELVKELSKRSDMEVTYLMPYGPKNISTPNAKLLVADNIATNISIKTIKVPSMIGAYISESEYLHTLKHTVFDSESLNNSPYNEKDNTFKLYGPNLLSEVYRFAQKSAIILKSEPFDIIHAHDWTTFPAAITVKELYKKPLIVHIHITEFNKSGGNSVNQHIYNIEREGMEKADAVIVISHLMKNLCIEKYGINPEKIHVIHNANVGMNELINDYDSPIKDNNQIVLFAGRMTLQKGPEYFVEAAKKVSQIKPNVKFVMAGSGDMLQSIINKVAGMGMADKFLFHGFYNREDAEKFFAMADVFVMPSVSEPFGIVPLEAMIKKTPTIISKQSGVSEVLNHVLKVDFWDTDELANKIVALLNYSALNTELKTNGYNEAKSLTWDAPANKCVNLYYNLINTIDKNILNKNSKSNYLQPLEIKLVEAQNG